MALSRHPRQCLREDGSPKRAYDSRWAAQQAAKRSNRDDRNGQPVSAYWCRLCGLFHVGRSGLEP